MSQEQSISRLLDQSFIVECIEQDNLQEVNTLIEQLQRKPTDRSELGKPIRKGETTVFVSTHVLNIFVLMVEYNYLDALRACAKRYPIADWGIYALNEASTRGNQTIVELLLKEKADPFSADPRRGRTALHSAALMGYPHIVEILVQSLKTTPLLDEKNSSRKTWHQALNQECILGGHRRRWTPLDCAVKNIYRVASGQFSTCYQQIRTFEEPFDKTVAQEAVTQFYAELPGTRAQAYFDAITKLFEAGASDPSQSSYTSPSVFEKALGKLDIGREEQLRIPIRLTELRLFFVESVLNPHIMELFKRAKYAPALAFLGGLHHRTGARSLFPQLQRTSTMFDVQVLRIPLRLAGVPEKSPVTSTFFPRTRYTATASSASSASTAKVESTPTDRFVGNHRQR